MNRGFKTHPPTRLVGFTLIELLVVIVILMVSLTVAIPSASRLIERKRVGDAVEAIISYVYTARSEAIARSTIVYMEIDKPNSTDIRFALSTTIGCDLAVVNDCRLSSIGTNNLAEADDAAYSYRSDNVIYTPNATTAVTDIQFDPFQGTVTTDGNTPVPSPTFTISVDDGSGTVKSDDFCKNVTVGFLGQITVQTGRMSGGACS